MNVLIACEESQAVCIEMRRLGHRAFSCDLQDCSGGHPEWHIKGDVLPLLNGYKGLNNDPTTFFWTQDGTTYSLPPRWDLIIAHPPCDHLAVSGARWFPEKQRDFRQQKAVVFFMQMCLANCKRIAVENPIGIMNSIYRKPDQIIQPYQYGHPIRKATCLWLKGLPKLVPTDEVSPGAVDKYGFTIGGALQMARDENGKIISWNDPRTAKIRSKTFPGIARAMAEQWAGDIREDTTDDRNDE